MAKSLSPEAAAKAMELLKTQAAKVGVVRPRDDCDEAGPSAPHPTQPQLPRHDAEPPQGANLVAQINEMKLLMEQDRKEYEERRKEQDRKLEFLMNMAELQHKKAEDTPVEPEGFVEHVLQTPPTKAAGAHDEWQSANKDPWERAAKKKKEER